MAVLLVPHHPSVRCLTVFPGQNRGYAVSDLDPTVIVEIGIAAVLITTITIDISSPIIRTIMSAVISTIGGAVTTVMTNHTVMAVAMTVTVEVLRTYVRASEGGFEWRFVVDG